MVHGVDERKTVDWRFGDVDLSRIGIELENFRVALEELAVSDPVSYVSLVWKLRGFCHSRGHIREGAHWSAEAVRLARDLPSWAKARAWQTEASFAFHGLELERAAEWYRKALAQRTGDQPDDAVESAWIVRTLSLIALLRGQDEESDALSAQALVFGSSAIRVPWSWPRRTPRWLHSFEVTLSGHGRCSTRASLRRGRSARTTTDPRGARHPRAPGGSDTGGVGGLRRAARLQRPARPVT